MAKVTDLIKSEVFTFSLEVTPAVSHDAINKVDMEPAFIAVTWHAKSLDLTSLDIEPLKLASYLRSKGKNVLMHLSCDQLKKEYLNKILKFLEEKGVCNLFVVLGESYEKNGSEFKNSKEMIVHIRQQTGNYFCIGVAGFPDQSDDVNSLKQLKDKIDAGVDFIITQAFLQYESYKKYATKCKEIGIKVPVIPGIFVYDTFKQLVAFTNLCKIKISPSFLDYVKNNDTFSGIDVVKEIAVELKKTGPCSNHIHMFTQNKLVKASSLLKEIQ